MIVDKDTARKNINKLIQSCQIWQKFKNKLRIVRDGFDLQLRSAVCVQSTKIISSVGLRTKSPETRFGCFIHLINTKLTQNCCEKNSKANEILEQIPTTLQQNISTSVIENILHLFSPRLTNTLSTGVLRFSMFQYSQYYAEA